MEILRRWGILLGAWAGVALFSSGATWLSWMARDLPGNVPMLLMLEGPVWSYWVAASVGAVVLSRRYPLDRSRPWTSIGIHLVAAIVIGTLFVGFRMVWYQAFNPQPYTDPHVALWFWRTFREHFVGGFILYWAIVGVYHAFTNYSRLQQRELESTIVRGQLAEARLEALQVQLRPHFLFNALNTASAVLEEHPRRARRIIGRLGEVLRATLRTNARHLVSLGEELELVAAYLEIEEERFGGRLLSEFDVPPDVANAAVPNFLLQPLVENAIRHGISRRPGPGRVAVRVRHLGGQLVIHVEDDGVGLRYGPIREGIGLGNTRRRLRELYQADQAVTLHGRPSGGLDVCVRFPFVPLQPEPRAGAA